MHCTMNCLNLIGNAMSDVISLRSEGYNDIISNLDFVL